MPKSNHSNVSSAYISSISDASGNYGGREAYDRRIPSKDIRKWASEHYPAPPTTSDYVSTYNKGEHYHKGSREHRDHVKYSTICSQAKKKNRNYEDLRDEPLLPPFRDREFLHQHYRQRVGTASSDDVDHHAIMRPHAEKASEAWERSARNRDKFQQKHPTVLWDVDSYNGHRGQAISEYTIASQREEDRRKHVDYSRGGHHDRKKEMVDHYKNTGRSNEIQDARAMLDRDRDYKYYGSDFKYGPKY